MTIGFIKSLTACVVFLVSQLCHILLVQGQPHQHAQGLVRVAEVPHTAVKNQGNTGTCWSFSTTSLIESQTLKNGGGEIDLSEMFTVRNVYLEKARNYLFRQGVAQFGAGGLGHDVIRAIAVYGAVPENVYPGKVLGEKNHDHSRLDARLKSYLDSLLKLRPVPTQWMDGFTAILDDHLGKMPEKFLYKEKQYTPRMFAAEILRFNADDYVNFTSFSHHPFYTSFILEAPDNFLNGSYHNVPLKDMITLTTRAVEQGYSVMWDSDVSNKCFRQQDGFAMQWKNEQNIPKTINPDDEEMACDQSVRQRLYESLVTQDDHLMHIVGIKKSAGGKLFFLVKNSWGEVGPFKGLIHVSEAYFALNTVSLVIPKAALSEELRDKLGIRP